MTMDKDNKKIEKILSEFAALAEGNGKIKPSLYSKYNVKRGLRNEDGSGVLVGLTEIGDVHGYIIDENEKVPVEGNLLYRGINIFDIVKGFQTEKRYGFEETCFLLLFGELPSEKELKDFNMLMHENSVLPEGFVKNMIFSAPSNNVMNKIERSVLSSYSYDENAEDTDCENTLKQSMQLIARMAQFASYAYQAKEYSFNNSSLIIHAPSPELQTAENILHMIRTDSKYTESEARTLDLCLVLHAEHGGGNNSAFTTKVVTSSGTDTYSAITAAIGSLKGPRHGGANIRVVEMMDEIKSNVKDWTSEKEVGEYLEKILRKEAYDKSGLIYGIGHAVYTLSDPRCVLLKGQAELLAEEKGCMDEYKLYELIERLAPIIFENYKGISKPLCANVDFYSGFVYSMLNIPRDLYTPLFAVSRIVGWCAHRIEELINGGRIIRPAYKNVSKKNTYVALSER